MSRPAGRLARSERPQRLPLLVVGLLSVATVGALFAGNGNLAVALAPCALALVVWAVWFLPLRSTMLVLLFLAWCLESPGDAFACGLIATPWRLIGSLLWGKLNLVLPFSPLVFSGLDVLLLFLFAVVVHRHLRGSTLDQDGWVDSAAPLGTFAFLSIVAALWMATYGMARGGSSRFVLWQIIRWLYLPIIYAFMNQALRGPRDAILVARVVLAAGIFRSGEALVFRAIYPDMEFMPHATTHADSVLFATCIGLLLAINLEKPSGRSLKLSALLLPLFVAAIQANNRRLVWAEIGLVILFFWFVLPWRPFKRKIARALILGAVPLTAYFAVGWSIKNPVFFPVQKVRSLIDGSANSSTLWRDLENYDLVYTFSQNPLLGSGFGHPFIQRIRLPDVTRSYELEPYIPHNSVLGLWAFGGLVGFSLIWAVFPVGMFFTARAYRCARTPGERITALGAGAVQVCYVMQGYGDLGFGSWGPIFTVAAAYALVGKICVSNGAWALATDPETVPPVPEPAPLRDVSPIAPAPPAR